MTFSKIDLDAVAAEEPLDAFVLQGAAANDGAAYEERGRRASFAFSSEAPPILGSSRLWVWPLAVWPLSPGCSEITVDLLGIVQDDSVEVGLAILESNRLSTTQTTQTLSTSGGARTLYTLTLDTTGRSGVIVVCLLVRSQKATSTKHNYNATQTLNAGGFVDLNGGHPFTLNQDKRYSLLFTDHSSTPDSPGPAGYPDEFEVMEFDSGSQYVRVWPASTVAYYSFQSGKYAIEIYLIGSIVLYGAQIAETGWGARVDLSQQLQPAYPPAVPPLSALHARLYQQHLRTAVHAAGPVPNTNALDADSRVICRWGQVVDASTNSWVEAGQAWLGDYGDDEVAVDAPSSATYTRGHLWVCGLVAVASSDGLGYSGDTLTLDVRAVLRSWSGTAWTASQDEQPDTDGADVVCPIQTPSNYTTRFTLTAGDLVSASWPVSGAATSAPALTYHALRGGWPSLVFDPPDGRVGPVARETVVVPFVIEIEDPEAGSGVDRSLTVEIKGDDRTDSGVLIRPYTMWAQLVTLTILTRPEVV
jgi:hypothetical protein